MMFKWIGGFIDRLFAVAGALLFLQLPEFMIQYSHRLAGHVEELKHQVFLLQQASLDSGKSLQEYIKKFTTQADPDFSNQGQFMEGLITRYEELSQTYYFLLNASPLEKPWVFLANLKFDIAQMTFSHYSFGITLTLEGLIYALFGIGIGYFLFWLCTSMILAPFSSLKKIFIRFWNKNSTNKPL